MKYFLFAISFSLVISFFIVVKKTIVKWQSLFNNKKNKATSGIDLVNSNPKDIVSLTVFGKAIYNKMVQNLGWAAGYNVVALPLATGVLYKIGILLSPAMGAVLMSVSKKSLLLLMQIC